MGKKKHDPATSLADEPFSYRTSKDGVVFVSWRGRQVTILRGDKAEAFLKRVAGLDPSKQQLAMARVTGNVKRGTERS